MLFDDPRLDESCMNCRFYLRYTYSTKDGEFETENGECRRYPPVIQESSEIIRNKSVFPIVRQDQWCGEFDI